MTTSVPSPDPAPLPDPVPLYGPAYKTDPYPLYERMREAGPVHRVRFPSGVGAWLVTGYQAAYQALNDSRLGKNHTLGNEDWRRLASIMPEPQHSQLQVHLLHQDPPQHTVLRRLVMEAFMPRRMEAFRPRVQEIADELVDALPDTAGADGADGGNGGNGGDGGDGGDGGVGAGVDLVAGFAAAFPFRVLCEAIGLPGDLAERFDQDWRKVVQPVGPQDPGRPAYERRLRELQGFIADVVADKRMNPGGDLLGRLVALHDDGEITKEETDSMIFQLLVAGQEPVTNQISTALLNLLRHPRDMERLRAHPELLPNAVEELIRLDSAFELTTWRFFAEDSDLHGVRIPAGDSVIVSLCAANRDPLRFPEPDTLDLDRTPNPHLGFGHGIHFCAGAALARVELQVALGTLLDRLEGLAPAENAVGTIEWTTAVLSRGVDRVPVTYTRRRPAEAATGRGLSGVDRTCAAIMEMLVPYRRAADPEQPVTPRDFPEQLRQLAEFVEAGDPIVFALPGFPCKSPNPAKVLGHLPDEGERLALRFLNDLAHQIEAIYPPGVRMLICSDGHVFGDLIGVPDENIDAYGDELRVMIEREGLDRLSTFDLRDVLGDLPCDEKRTYLHEQHAPTLEQLRAEVAIDEDTLRFYRGMTRFLVADTAEWHGTRSALQRDCRRRAYGMIQRSRAWSDLVATHHPRSVRLSIHPQRRGSAKFGIRLLDAADLWTTPWHSVIVRHPDGRRELMRRADAERLGDLVHRDGRPSHYEISAAAQP